MYLHIIITYYYYPLYIYFLVHPKVVRIPYFQCIDLKKKCFFSTAASRNGPGFWEGTLELSIRTFSARKSGHPKGFSRPGWPAACLVVWGVGLGSYFVEDKGDFLTKNSRLELFWSLFFESSFRENSPIWRYKVRCLFLGFWRFLAYHLQYRR